MSSLAKSNNSSASTAFTKVCVAILTFTLTLTMGTDSLQIVPLSEIAQRQNHLLKMSLNKHALCDIRGKDSDNEDVCAWKRTGCTNGVVTSVWAQDTAHDPKAEFSVLIEWFPPTLKFIHFEDIVVQRLYKLLCLPRDLKYLYLKSYGDYRSRITGFDFSRLPPKMEELILVRMNICGTIRFVGLPETMRAVYFCVCKGAFNRFVVDYNSLPRTVKSLHASIYEDPYRRVNVEEIGKPRSLRIQTKNEQGKRIAFAGSNYYATLHRRASCE